MKKRTILLIAALCTAADQGVKAALEGRRLVLIPGVIGLDWTKNTGFALGLFPGGVTAALILSAAVFLALLVLLWKTRVSGVTAVGLALVLGGALGNLIDRAFLGYVRDMFEFLFVRFSIFNLADACVTVGAALAAFGVIFREGEWGKT